MLMNISLTSRITKHLMFTEAKMKKDRRSLPGTDTMEPTRDGRLAILIRPKMTKKKALTRNSVWYATSHSI
jgi:hypothetical protein